MTTGWPPGLLQDDSRELSDWFASRIDAKYTVRKVCAEIERKRMSDKQPEALELADMLDAAASAAAARLRAYHAAIERKDALLRQALEALYIGDGRLYPEVMKVVNELKKELANDQTSHQV